MTHDLRLQTLLMPPQMDGLIHDVILVTKKGFSNNLKALNLGWTDHHAHDGEDRPTNPFAWLRHQPMSSMRSASSKTRQDSWDWFVHCMLLLELVTRLLVGIILSCIPSMKLEI